MEYQLNVAAIQIVRISKSARSAVRSLHPISIDADFSDIRRVRKFDSFHELRDGISTERHDAIPVAGL